MYDSHIHLSESSLGHRIDGLLSSFAQAGGKGVLNVAYDNNSINTVLDQARSAREIGGVKILTSVGIHPDLFVSGSHSEPRIKTMSRTAQILKELKNRLDDNESIIDAIGETGLDYFKIEQMGFDIEEAQKAKELQRYSFRYHVEEAVKRDLPLTIHTREARGSSDCIDDAIKIICSMPTSRGSFHSFTGNREQLDQLKSLGFMVGVNGIITYNSGQEVKNVFREDDLDHILLETDAPYLPVDSVRRDKTTDDRVGKPEQLTEIAQTLADHLGYSTKQLVEITDRNFEHMFGVGLH